MEALKIENLTKHFGGLQVTNNVSFKVAPGERLAIIGPNGAGKTTLLNLIAGSLPPARGHVYFYGQDITTKPVFERAQLGILRSFQITSLFLDLTVLENILLALHGKRSSRYHILRNFKSYHPYFDEAKELLTSINLWEKRDSKVREIAYGEQRKLEIILCLASNPKILLLDEPSCGLTNQECSDIIRFLKELEKDITVIMIAHDMDLVYEIAQRIIVLYYGGIIVDDVPDRIRVHPRVAEIYMGLEGVKQDA